MAGSGSIQKKSLLSQETQMLLKTCNKIQESDKTKNETETATENLVGSVDTSNRYATWPSARLRATIEERVHAFCNVDQVDFNFIDEVELELNKEFSTEVEEQLDFCMMCSQMDHIEAVELQKNLCLQYDLVGKVFWECIPLGRDLFSVIEEMVNNSTRLLFYITERFDDTDACAYVAKNLLAQDNQGTNRKVIPLVTKFDTLIPETFHLIDRLYLCSKLQFQFRFPAVFSKEVRLEKVLRAEKLRKKLDNERMAVLQILVQKKLGV